MTGYLKIEKSYTYAEYLLSRVLPQVNNFYWEYRFRELDQAKIDCVYELHGQKDRNQLREFRNLDYEVKQISDYRNETDSLKIHRVNSDRGITKCIPDGNCFHYIIFVKNDSIKIVDNFYSLHKFILPVNSCEKAFLWSIWKNYDLSHTGYYKQQGDVFELVAERIIESRKLKNGRWVSKVAIVHVKINSSGEIRETILSIRKYKVDYRMEI